MQESVFPSARSLEEAAWTRLQEAVVRHEYLSCQWLLECPDPVGFTAKINTENAYGKSGVIYFVTLFYGLPIYDINKNTQFWQKQILTQKIEKWAFGCTLYVIASETVWLKHVVSSPVCSSHLSGVWNFTEIALWLWLVIFFWDHLTYYLLNFPHTFKLTWKFCVYRYAHIHL